MPVNLPGTSNRSGLGDRVSWARIPLVTDRAKAQGQGLEGLTTLSPDIDNPFPILFLTSPVVMMAVNKHPTSVGLLIRIVTTMKKM